MTAGGRVLLEAPLSTPDRGKRTLVLDDGALHWDGTAFPYEEITGWARQPPAGSVDQHIIDLHTDRGRTRIEVVPAAFTARRSRAKQAELWEAIVTILIEKVEPRLVQALADRVEGGDQVAVGLLTLTPEGLTTPMRAEVAPWTAYATCLLGTEATEVYLADPQAPDGRALLVVVPCLEPHSGLLPALLDTLATRSTKPETAPSRTSSRADPPLDPRHRPLADALDGCAVEDAGPGVDLTGIDPAGDGFVAIGGHTFGGGLLRFHTAASSRAAAALVADYFPELDASVVPLSFDWMGQQFVAHPTQGMLLLDPSGAEILVTERTADELILEDFVEDPDLLDAGRFRTWLSAGGRAPGFDECVGHRHPLLLGGADELANLEITDLEVHWTLLAQARNQLKDLPPGTEVTGFTVDE